MGALERPGIRRTPMPDVVYTFGLDGGSCTCTRSGPQFLNRSARERTEEIISQTSRECECRCASEVQICQAPVG